LNKPTQLTNVLSQRDEADKKEMLRLLDNARADVASGKTIGFVYISETRDGSYYHSRVMRERYTMIGLLHSIIKDVLEE